MVSLALPVEPIPAVTSPTLLASQGWSCKSLAWAHAHHTCYASFHEIRDIYNICYAMLCYAMYTYVRHDIGIYVTYILSASVTLWGL